VDRWQRSPAKSWHDSEDWEEKVLYRREAFPMLPFLYFLGLISLSKLGVSKDDASTAETQRATARTPIFGYLLM
jgi:hypothetical protein